MKQKFPEPIDELKFYLNLQLEAYHQGNLDEYDKLERRILEVEKML